LIWKGLSYHEVAKELHLAKLTVRNRVHRLLKRRGFPSSRAAAEWAYRRGLFEPMDFQEEADSKMLNLFISIKKSTLII